MSVAPITKEAQRVELHRTIWRIANDLRGSVNGWEFKSYVLGMPFYMFISENLAAYLNEQERKGGDPDFDYTRLPHKDAEYGRAETVAEKGFFILPGDLFVNVRAKAKSDPNLNETLERVFRNIEASAIGADSEDDPRVCSTTSTSTAPSSATLWRDATRSSQGYSMPSAT